MSTNDLKDIRDNLGTKKLVIGQKETMKNILNGLVSKVYVSKNCPKQVLDDITRYSKLSKFKLSVLDSSNEDLGVICKKPFSITVLSVLNQAKK